MRAFCLALSRCNRKSFVHIVAIVNYLYGVFIRWRDALSEGVFERTQR